MEIVDMIQSVRSHDDLSGSVLCPDLFGDLGAEVAGHYLQSLSLGQLGDVRGRIDPERSNSQLVGRTEKQAVVASDVNQERLAVIQESAADGGREIREVILHRLVCGRSVERGLEGAGRDLVQNLDHAAGKADVLIQ